MSSMIPIVQSVIVVILTYLFSKHKENKMFAIIHSILNGAFIYVYLILVFYYPFLNAYLNPGIYVLLVTSFIEITYLLIKKSDFNQMLKTTYNTLLISSVLNMIVFFTLKTTPNMYYIYQILIMVLIIICYLIYQVLIHMRQNNNLDYFRNIWVLLIILLILPLFIVKTDTESYNLVSVRDFNHLIIKDNITLEEYHTLSENTYFKAHDMLFTDHYILYVMGNEQKKTLYKYDLETNVTEVIYHHLKNENGADTYIDINQYNDDIYILDNMSLYYLENDSLVELMNRDYDETKIENMDYYHALYFDDDKLNYITETNRYTVNENSLTLNNVDYDPNWYMHSLYEDQYGITYETMYKFSNDLDLYNVIVLRNRQGVYETRNVSGVVNYANMYNTRFELTSDRENIFTLSNQEINEIVINQASYTLTISYSEERRYSDFKLIHDNTFYMNLKTSIFHYVIHDNYYLVSLGYSSTGDKFIRIYTIEHTKPTLNPYITNFIKSDLYWISLSLLFLPIYIYKKRVTSI